MRLRVERLAGIWPILNMILRTPYRKPWYAIIAFVMNNLPTAIQPPDPRVNLRPVRYADIEAIQANCWPTRPLPAIRRLVLNAQHNAIQGYGLGVVALSESTEVIG